MKKLLFDCGCRETAVAPGLFFLRAATGLMMLIGHGIPKIQNFAAYRDDDFYAPFEFMSPTVALIGAIGAEVVAASLLVLGLLTRPAAFVFGFAMVVAAFGRHALDPWFGAGGPAKELAVMYLIPVVTILLAGAGRWSADAALYKAGKRRRW